MSFEIQEVELANNLHLSMTEEESYQSIKEILIWGEPPTTRMKKHTQRLIDKRPIVIITISLENIKIPKSLTKVLKGKNNDFWRKITMIKFKVIYNTNTFKKIILELLQKIKRNELQVCNIRTILIIKTNAKEEISRNKVWVVVQSYTMREKVDYDLTFTLMAYILSIHLLIAKICHNKWKIYQVDCLNAYLNGFS
jgi:hypothetical protein